MSALIGNKCISNHSTIFMVKLVRSRVSWALAIVAGLALAACGGDDDSARPSKTSGSEASVVEQPDTRLEGTWSRSAGDRTVFILFGPAPELELKLYGFDEGFIGGGPNFKCEMLIDGTYRTIDSQTLIITLENGFITPGCETFTRGFPPANLELNFGGYTVNPQNELFITIIDFQFVPGFSWDDVPEGIVVSFPIGQ